MACYHPSKIDVQRKPFREFPSRLDAVTVPCGKCLGCRADQGRQWAIRLMHESVLHPSSTYFATLTYAPEHLPGDSEDSELVRGSLDPDATQRFMKRLRRRSGLQKISYFLCGEYGETTDRPHYHLALFGAPFLDKEHVGDRAGYPVFRSELLSKVWPFGLSELTSLSWKSASYVAGYVRKKAIEAVEPTRHLRVDKSSGELFEVEPEFQRMSRRPALGRLWLEKYWQDVYPRDFVVMDGSPIKPPRYYDRWMERYQPEVMEEVRYQRWKDAEEIGDDQLIMREKVHRARLGLQRKRDRI